jgi:hypothetical protein
MWNLELRFTLPHSSKTLSLPAVSPTNPPKGSFIPKIPIFKFPVPVIETPDPGSETHFPLSLSPSRVTFIAA